MDYRRGLVNSYALYYRNPRAEKHPAGKPVYCSWIISKFNPREEMSVFIARIWVVIWAPFELGLYQAGCGIG